MARKQLSFAIVLALFTAGCGGGSTPGDQQAAATGKAGNLPGPDKTVAAFLEAVRVGNDDQASQMLSPLARQRTAERDLVVAPPGSETAKFQVGEVEVVGDDAAHVASSWTDIDETGQPHTDQIVWILRRESEGWRIAGMGTKIFPDQPPLFLNFEDPDDMLRKQQLAEQEMRRRAGLDSPGAESPPLQAQQTPSTDGTMKR